jgi:hypothetical protein
MTAIPVGTMRNAPSEALSMLDECDNPLPWPAEGVAAVVMARDGRDARIARDGVTRAARIAFGCLIQPEPGDQVLASLADGTVWIISVLDRQSGKPPRLWTDGDLAIVSERGNIYLSAAQAVEICSGETVRVAAPEIDLHAGIGRFVLDELLQVGRRANLYVAKIRSVCDMVETFAEHALTRVKRSSRFIEDSDQVRAGDIDYRAEGNLQLQAETAFITADTVVRVDAEQIHMG